MNTNTANVNAFNKAKNVWFFSKKFVNVSIDV